MKLKFVSWLAPVAALALVACSGADLDEPNDMDESAQDQDQARTSPEDHAETAWVPGTPMPTDSHIEGVEHHLTLDWIKQEDSIAALTDHSRLVISGQVESTRYDVIRAYSQAKGEDQLTGEESGIYNDLPVTIATVKIDELARSTGGLETPSGDAVAAGTTIDVMFAGGLLSDGCTLEADDNPLPTVGEQTVLFLDTQARADAADKTDTPLATDSLNGIYAVTGGPLGRVVVEDGVIKGSFAPGQATAVDKLTGEPVETLFDLVRAQAAIGEYVPPEEREAPVAAPEDHHRPNALGGCGIGSWNVEWCRRPTNVTYADHASNQWPVGDALDNWMHTHLYNSLYLYWQSGGTSDVTVWEDYYGYTNWYGYATYRSWNGCITTSEISLNNTYYNGWHHAMTTTLHEVGHSLGFDHAPSCESIMYSDPTACSSTLTYCDAQAASQVYPY